VSVNNEVAELTPSYCQLALNLVIIVVSWLKENFIAFKSQKWEKFPSLDEHVTAQVRAFDFHNAVRIDQAIRSSCKKGVCGIDEKTTIHNIKLENLLKFFFSNTFISSTMNNCFIAKIFRLKDALGKFLKVSSVCGLRDFAEPRGSQSPLALIEPSQK